MMMMPVVNNSVNNDNYEGDCVDDDISGIVVVVIVTVV